MTGTHFKNWFYRKKLVNQFSHFVKKTNLWSSHRQTGHLVILHKHVQLLRNQPPVHVVLLAQTDRLGQLHQRAKLRVGRQLVGAGRRRRGARPLLGHGGNLLRQTGRRFARWRRDHRRRVVAAGPMQTGRCVGAGVFVQNALVDQNAGDGRETLYKRF